MVDSIPERLILPFEAIQFLFQNPVPLVPELHHTLIELLPGPAPPLGYLRVGDDNFLDFTLELLGLRVIHALISETLLVHPIHPHNIGLEGLDLQHLVELLLLIEI